MSQLNESQIATCSSSDGSTRKASSPSLLVHPGVRSSLSSTRSRTPPSPAAASGSSVASGSSPQNGMPRNRSFPAVENLHVQNGEPSPKVQRTLGLQSATSTREPRFPSLRTVGEDDVQYERVIRTLLHYEKLEPGNGSMKTLPVTDTPEKAAIMSRIPADSLTEREETYFPEIAQGSQTQKDLHCLLRNMILLMWLKNPKKYVLVPNVIEYLKESSPSLTYDQEHLVKIVRFLNRVCLINFGDVTIGRPSLSVRQQRHIIVIGAGISGLAAAKQLKSFGFRVTVIEGRNHPGGRIDAWYAQGSKTLLAEKGASLITGLEGNPLFPVIHDQLGLKLEALDFRCPIFENNGNHVSIDRDEVLECEFADLISEAGNYFRHYYSGPGTSGAAPGPGMGKCVMEVLKSRELDVAMAAAHVLEERSKRIQELTGAYKKRHELHHRAESVISEYDQVLRRPSSNQTDDCIQRLKATLTELKTKIQNVEQDIKMKEKVPDLTSPDLNYSCYIADNDRKILSWHMANYDFANAMPIENLSVEHLIEDEELELKGGHFFAPGGLAPLTDRLANGVDILHNHKVSRISYVDQKPVTVSVRTLYNAPKEFHADAVIVTLPLGVLKNPSTVQFYPPLPHAKAESIKKLGFGVMNKVVLLYQRKFWKTKRTVFGYASPEPDRRGEFFFFWGVYDQPILIALIAGKKAESLEKVDNTVIVHSCTQVLQNIFGKNVVGLPKESFVTRWGSDEFSRGSYSSVPVGASGADFDVLAEPILVDGLPKVCFAGEHTERRFPGTMHGAFLSGLREATRIADALGGVDSIF